MNIQLTGKEAVKVFVEIGTKRILGFAPEKCAPLFPGHIRYTEYTLLHAKEVERWVAKYREQQERDAEEATARQIEREAPFRRALRYAIRERNKHVNPLNRNLNETFVKLMDRRYDQIMQAKSKPVVHGMAEASEANANQVADFAMESPAYRNPGDMRARGGAVRGELEKIEHDKRN
jgi:hypothetical protein